MSEIQALVQSFGGRLSQAVEEFLSRNGERFPGEPKVAERWRRAFKQIQEDALRVQGPVEMMALSLHTLNLLTTLGAVAGITLEGISLESVPEGWDRGSVERLLYAVQGCMYLQFLGGRRPGRLLEG